MHRPEKSPAAQVASGRSSRWTFLPRSSKSVSIKNRIARRFRFLSGEFQKNIQELCVPIRRWGRILGNREPQARACPLRALSFDLLGSEMSVRYRRRFFFEGFPADLPTQVL